jgi:hypothetical protein
MSNIFNGEGGKDHFWRQSDEERHRRHGFGQVGRQRRSFERASDETRPWFGDEDAERRRRPDERGQGREEGANRSGYDPTDRPGYRADYESQTWREGYAGQGPHEGGADYEAQTGGEYNHQGGSYERRHYGAQGYGGQYRGGQGYGGYGDYGHYEESYGETEFWMTPGPYTGQGPMGYHRSDERIREDVCERLTQHGWIDAGKIEVEVSRGEVTLKGSVGSRASKRMAEETAESVSGVLDVQNQIRVNREQSQGVDQAGADQPSEYGQRWQSDQPPQRPDKSTQ